MVNKNVIKKILLFTVPFLFSPLIHANYQNKNDLMDCRKYENDKIALKESPGYYYYRIGICMYEHIKSKNEFVKTSEMLEKSASYNYPLSNFSLGFLYDTKYRLGSEVFNFQGKPQDLITAIENYEKAAIAGSATAQNNLGVIYLHEANLGEDMKTKEEAKDVRDNNAPIPLPDINKALYWLQAAAHNGNPAAQGTLEDLYKQGIGFPQDYVLAYVWSSLSFASQMRFNKMMQTKLGEKSIPGMIQERDNLYKSLTDNQKDAAQKLLREYQEKYFHYLSALDEACSNTQAIMGSHNVMRLMSMMKNAYRRVRDYNNSIRYTTQCAAMGDADCKKGSVRLGQKLNREVKQGGGQFIAAH